MPGGTKRLVVFAALSAGLWAVACGDRTPLAPSDPVVETAGPMPSVALTVGGEAVVEAADYFRDPEGETVTYVARTEGGGVAEVTVEDGAVRVRGLREGTAEVTVTARSATGATGEMTFSAYVGNADSPQTPAPTPPARDSLNVVSLFSAAYKDVTVTTWSAYWDQADVKDTVIAGDAVKKYTNLVFAGIEFPLIDATSMTHIHMDVWTPDATASPAAFKIKLVDFGADGAYAGGDDSEHELSYTAASTPALVTGAWIGFDIPLADFTSLDSTANLAQLLISGNPNTVYVDNVYLYREADRDVLEMLYDSTGGDGWTHKGNWLSNRPVGEWYGVEVNDAGRVVTLDLDENGLVGMLPGALEGLAELETLELYRNSLSGPLPPELGNLANLKALHLWQNSFSGQIPVQLANLANLTRLHIGTNSFSGSIPPELGGLTNLRLLVLGANPLSGSIPVELGNLTQLEVLNLGTSDLSGAVPSSLGNLTNLEDLYLDNNDLSGALPPALPGGLANLDHVYWYNNDGLCAPYTNAFSTWLAGIPDTNGPRCDPPAAPTPPSREAADVISLFSGAYANVTVDTWSADWDQANVADVDLGGDAAKKYTNLVYAGIEFTSQPVDASSMERFHIDIWTPDVTALPALFKIKLVDFGADGVYGGGDDSEHEVTKSARSVPALATAAWVSFDFSLNDFSGLDSRTHLAQLLISGDPNTVFVDNVYLYRMDPQAAAPTPPARRPADVISLFSGAYSDVTVDMWSTDWDQADVEDVVVAGDATKKYTNLVFSAIEFSSEPVDASSMERLHLDIWTPDPTAFPAALEIKLVDFGADGAYAGGDDSEHELSYTARSVPALATGQWIGFDIPLSDFTGLTSRAHLAQLLIANSPGSSRSTLYVDNVYLYRAAPTGPPPAPTVDSVVAGANPGTLDVVWSWSLGNSACDNVVAYFVDYKKSSESAWNTYAAWDANDADHGTYQVWEDLGTSVSSKRFTIGPSTTGHNPGEVGVTLDDVQYDVRVHIYSTTCEAGAGDPYGTSAPMSGWPNSSGGG